MQIDFTKKEYRIFLDILEVADWMLFAHRIGKPKTLNKYSDFEQKIYSHAEAFGFGDLIGHNKDSDEYFPLLDCDEISPVRPFIDEFEDNTFWEELTGRLAGRDMLRKLGEREILKMTMEERITACEDFEDEYKEEFQKHGIERLQIKD